MAIGIGIGVAFNKHFNWDAYWEGRTPSGLLATTDSGSQITLNWTNNGVSDYTGNKVYISTDGIIFTLNQTISSIGTTAIITGLSANTVYLFYVVPYRGSSEGNRSNIEAEVTSIADADGNIYTSVVIGVQRWLVENLKTTKYNDGSAIPTGLSNADWALEDGTAGHDGAFAQVNNDAGNKAVYGLLWNWFALTNVKGVAPRGYTVGTNAQALALQTYLSTLGKNLGAIKEAGISHWTTPNTGAESYGGLKELPAGLRNATTGAYSSFGTYDVVHIADSFSASNSYRFYLAYDAAAAVFDNEDKRWGNSVKCISTDNKFKDDFLENILTPESIYGEPTALVSDDGNQIDLWCFVTDRLYYTYSTDGLTFASPVVIDIPVSYKRSHILKYNDVYYMYASDDDQSIRLFTSSNKINFSDQGEVLTKSVGDWDSLNVANSFVWQENDGANWYMMYDGQNGGASVWQTGLATASAPEGPWTKYGTTPVIPETATPNGAWQPEMARVNNEVIKHNGKYYIYYSNALIGKIKRAYSDDLITWTLEGICEDIKVVHAGMVSYGDECLVEFKGKSYLFFNPTNQVDTAHIDCAIDNRPLAAMLALPISN